jgi:hypothetical protein
MTPWALLNRILQPAGKNNLYVRLLTTLAQETDPDDVALMLLMADDIAARKLYNLVQPYHPIY